MRHCIKTVKFSSPSLNLKNAEVQIDIHPRDEQKQPRVTWFAGGKTFYSTDAHKLYPELKHSVARTTIYEASFQRIYWGRSFRLDYHFVPKWVRRSKSWRKE